MVIQVITSAYEKVVFKTSAITLKVLLKAIKSIYGMIIINNNNIFKI